VKSVFAQSTLVLTDASMEYIISNQKLEVFKDQNSKYDITNILANANSIFSKPFNDDVKTIDSEANYWIKFSVLNNTNADFRWLLEDYYLSAEQLVVYYQNSSGGFDSLSLASLESFGQRYVKHKNLVFPFPIAPNVSQTYYLKYKSSQGKPFQLILREANSFISYAIGEYFLFGLFYGIIAFLTLYSIVSFWKYQIASIGYFSVFISFLGLFFLSFDGIGFQFLWNSWPELNNSGNSIFLFCSVIGFTLFSAELLQIRSNVPLIYKLIWGFIGLRMIYLILQIAWPQHIFMPYIDVLPILLVLTIAIISWERIAELSIFFIAGVGFLLAVGIVYCLTNQDDLVVNNLVFYSFYVLPLLSVLCFYRGVDESLNTYRIRSIMLDTTAKELDHKIHNKTQEMLIHSKAVEERIKAQETFIFKVTHDLKGPLRSIVGLVKSARIDKKTAPEVYLDYILKSCERLDTVISDLLTISRTTSKDLQFGKIEFKTMIEDIVESFKGNSENSNFEVTASFEQNIDFYSENTLLYSVFQNLIENAMNYRNPEAKPGSFLHISIQESKEETLVYFKDNGLGIPEEFISRIFEMFYRVEVRQNSKSTGLGLYLVKIGLSRLQSSIEVQSKVGEGTTFILRLKNFYADVNQKEHCELELA
jgi:signal transduction histidine kinase